MTIVPQNIATSEIAAIFNTSHISVECGSKSTGLALLVHVTVAYGASDL